MKKRDYTVLKYITIIILLIFFTALTLCLQTEITYLLQPKNTVFSVLNKGEWLTSIIIIIYLILLDRMIFNEEKHEFSFLHKISSKLLICIIVLIVGFWCVNQTYVTNERLIVKSTLNWTGSTYTYEDVIGVETGFDKHSEFYYYVTLVDGTKIDMNCLAAINADRYHSDDTYLEIYDFDMRVIKSDIPKISVIDSMKYCNFDSEYYNRCEEIIMNQ